MIFRYSVSNLPLRLTWLLIVFFLLTISSGCSGDTGYKPINFSQTIAVSQPETQIRQPTTLRVAVAAMISPKETIVYYQELLDYLGKKLGYQVQLIQKKTYGEINDLFPKGQIDLAFICSGPYAVGKEIYGFEALATPQVRDEPFYRSYLIVNINSKFKRLKDLKGHVFAFTDPDSNTGTLVPNYWLLEMGVEPNLFFKKVTYTYSHDNSIMAVAKKLVDGAAIDGHKWEYYNRRSSFYTSMTRVIKKSRPFGSPPLVASTHLDKYLKEQIQQVLLAMHQDPDGSWILKELMIDRFVIPQEEWYQPVRQMFYRVQESRNMRYATEKS